MLQLDDCLKLGMDDVESMNVATSLAGTVCQAEMLDDSPCNPFLTPEF